jgi:Ca2+-binding RTX toxin-like protein
MASPFDDVVELYDYDITNNIFDGGAGQDTLKLMGGGNFVFPWARSLKNYEIIQGTTASDTIHLTSAQLAGIQKIDGGGATAMEKWDDALILQGTSINLVGKAITNFGSILVDTDHVVVRTDSLDLALTLNARYVANDALVLEHVTLTNEQRLELLDRGFDLVTDASGLTTVNAASTITGLNGDRTSIYAGASVRLDKGGDAVVSDDSGAIQELKVTLLNDDPGYAHEKFRLTATSHVKFSAGSFNSTVFVDGIDIGTYEGDWLGLPGLKFSFNVNATPERVTKVLHALTYQNTDTRSLTFDARKVEIAVVDYGGRETKTIVHLFNPRGNNVLQGGSDRDVLDGWSGNDKLYGGASGDILNGGAGKDLLYGQTGHDVFVFDTKPNKTTNLDRIADFNVKYDTIWLDNAVFTKLGKGTEAKPGKMNKFFFVTGDRAKDRNDHLVYDKKTGILSYDSDGSGTKQAVAFAQLAKNLKLTYDDFRII